ncbi:MarR family transcriptional regulator [Paenibacillus sp. IB182496]|uniref:MarR family transcriptional regulator n=1 Tax=Paenibacillus sabuli TaxID=2772509 RepID=A0A927GRM4_9BACL|nr:MarR family transcriptional regulator [Paenibacillus sabuli]MBD2844832.1 MarR family transcriptional regulator [Paenibacillus sabuli]
MGKESGTTGPVADTIAAAPTEQDAALKLLVVLSKAYKTVMDKAVKDMKQRGLSPSEFTILELLYNKGRVPLQQIGQKILVTSGSVTYNIDKLEGKSLIRRVPSPDDRRVVFAELTDQGLALLRRIFPEHAAAVQAIMAGLGYEEQLQATKLLKQLGKTAEQP